MRFLLGRFERGASEFYEEYGKNEKIFSHKPLKIMSKVTENLLRGIDYSLVKEKRTSNYDYLHQKLGSRNRLKIKHVEGAFSYPLLLEHGEEARKKLIEQKIYVPLLWPNVLREVNENSIEYRYAQNILPLPCDQRYDREDMERICQVIFNFCG